VKIADENAAVARFTNLLRRYGGRASDRDLAEHAMRWLASETIAGAEHPSPAILLADLELGSDPVHVTIVGAKSDPVAKTLFAAAKKLPGYKRIEWLDKREAHFQSDVTLRR